jgi:hypothetical protein
MNKTPSKVPFKQTAPKSPADKNGETAADFEPVTDQTKCDLLNVAHDLLKKAGQDGYFVPILDVEGEEDLTDLDEIKSEKPKHTAVEVTPLEDPNVLFTLERGHGLTVFIERLSLVNTVAKRALYELSQGRDGLELSRLLRAGNATIKSELKLSDKDVKEYLLHQLNGCLEDGPYIPNNTANHEYHSYTQLQSVALLSRSVMNQLFDLDSPAKNSEN